MMTIAKQRVKGCGPHCTCRACQVEWANYWEEQREIDEMVHRDRLVREHLAACDLERTWEGVEIG